jgi:AraC-like DNA-binding protein
MVMLAGSLTDDGRPYGTGDVRLSPGGDPHFVRFQATSTCLILIAATASTLPEVAERWSGVLPTPSITRLRLPHCAFRGTTRGELEGIVDTALSGIDHVRDSYRAAPPWLRELRWRVAGGDQRDTAATRMARHAGVSREHLSRSFHHHYGTSFTAFRRHRRVAFACRLLRTTTRSLADIACACDFADQSHMTRAFVRCLGTTPGAYRASCGAHTTSQTFKPDRMALATLNR